MEILLWPGIILILLVLIWLIWRVVGSIFFTMYSKHLRMPIQETPADYGLSFRDIEFKTDDGLKLKGWLVFPPSHGPHSGEGLPAVITTHGYSTNRSDIIERTVAVARAGFAVFTFDWRACGESEGDQCSGGLKEQSDLRAAIDTATQLPEVDPERIAIYGFSMGSAVAIIVAAEDMRLKAVAADSPFASMRDVTRHIIKSMFLPPLLFMSQADRSFRKRFGAGMRNVNVVAAVPKISPRPLLILSGRRDRVVPSWQPRKVFKAAKEPKQLEVNPHGGHFDNARPETMEKVIIPFLRNSLQL